MEELKHKILDYFKELTFKEKEHQYLCNDLPLKISVSGLIKQYKHPVNWDLVLRNTAKKRGITIEEVSQEWKKAADIGCERGNKAHIFGEFHALDRTLEPKTGYDRAIMKFWEDLPEHIVPLILEVKMYHKQYMFAGTADILLYNTKNGNLYLGDYKTNGDLFKNFASQKMVEPFKDLLCCSFNHYQLQLSYYQILLEQIPGVKISGRKLIWIKEDGTYLLYNTEDYTEILKQELKIKKI